MNWPEVVILLVTFKRTDYAVATVEALKENLVYPKLRWHVADDGSGEEHQRRIIEAIGDEYRGRRALTDANQAGGAGFNRNLGLQKAFEHSHYVLHIEDDWALQERYDLCPAVRVLWDNPHVGMIRFGYIEEGHTARSVALSGDVWWELQKMHNYVFTGHPHLLHKRLHDAYGYYPEKLLPGATEAEFATTVRDTKGPAILYPAWRPYGIFGHIGTVKAETFL